MIGHTQPRRIAARTIAARLAEELKSPLGEAVGFKIRFTDKTQDSTFIKLMTDGILLAETQGDRFLEQYEVLIIDEAHERSLNIDFLLGYLYQISAQATGVTRHYYFGHDRRPKIWRTFRYGVWASPDD